MNPSRHSRTPSTLALLALAGLIGCGSGSTTGSGTSGTTTTAAATTVTLTASAASIAVGSTLTLTATVTPSTATGTVTFYNGSTSLGTGTLASGVATLSTSFTAAGTYSLTADYGGATAYAAGDSASLALTVTAASAPSTPTIAMVAVPGGTFYDGVADMTVTGFNLSVYPITQAEYEAVMGANPSVSGSGSTHPVDSPNWYQVLVFCNLLSIADGLTPVYTLAGSTDPSAWGTVPASGSGANMTWDSVTMASGANGYRMPTSAEYMWAAMGGLSDGLASDISNGINVAGYLKGYAGSTEADGGTTDIGNYCWYSGNSGGSTQPVGGKLPNELGLYDMCGNVAEYTFDYYWGEEQGATNGNPVAIPFTSTNQTNYTGLTVGIGVWRWMLGGSFEDAPAYMTILPPASYVEAYNPSISKSFAGFRVATGGAF